jgi:hypothetical protein
MAVFRNARAFRAALLCVSASLLSLEISLMRVLKIEGFGNFTTAAVALALLGFAASGTIAGLWGMRRQGRRSQEPPRGARTPSGYRESESPLRFVFLYAPACLSMSLGLAFRLSETVSFDPLRILWDTNQLYRLLLRFSLYTLPFISGAAFVLAAFRVESPGKVYFFNLTGSAVGAFAPLLSFYVLSPGRVFLLPLAFSMSALLLVSIALSAGWKTAACSTLIAAAGIVLVLTSDVSVLPYRARQLALNLPDARVVRRRETPFGTLETIESEHLRYAPGLSLTYQGNLPEQLGLYLDGDRLAAIDMRGSTGGLSPETPSSGTRSPGSLQPDYLRRQIQYAPYDLRADPSGTGEDLPGASGDASAGGPRTLVVGLGGGVGVERALAGGAKDVTVVEHNPGLPAFLGDSLKERPDAPLARSPYAVVKGSPRRFLKRAAHTWDVIELSLPDSGVSSIGGIYSPSFDYSITEEAFGEYLRSLADDGVLSVTVTLQNPPRVLPKIIATARGALARRGPGVPADRVVALRSWSTGTVLIKNTPFLKEEIERIKAFCDRNCFDLVHYPGIREGETNLYNIQAEDLYYESGRAVLEDDVAFSESYVFDIRPPTDDRPYFFSFLRLRTTPFLFREMGKTWLPMVEGGIVVLFATLAAMSALSYLLIGVPLLVMRARMRGTRLKTFFYFSLIAAGYMFMEIMLMERLARVLANPMLSNSAVLASLLVFSGVGSYLSDLLRVKGRSAVFGAVGFIAAYGALILTCSDALNRSLAGVPLPLSSLCTILIVSPLAVAMGFPFPSAIGAVRDRDPLTLPWAWSINGCFSVLASLGAPLISIGVGLTALGSIAIACYAVSAFCFPS